MSFSNKVVIVTGASAGIGAATAIKFAQEGADVVIIGRNKQNLEKVAEEIKKVGKAPLVLKADISKDNEVKRIIYETITTYKKIDILVNNAGFSKNAGVLSGEIVEAYDAMFKTNVRAVIHMTILVAPHLIKTKGNIVNISSILGRKPMAGKLLIYSASKAAVRHFSKGAALELAEFGVRVNTVSPGPVATDFWATAGIKIDARSIPTPLKRISEPVEIADLILFVASEKAVGITGSEFTADNATVLV